MSAALGYFPEDASITPPPNHGVPISQLPSYQGSHMTAHSLVCSNWNTSGYGGMIQVSVSAFAFTKAMRRCQCPLGMIQVRALV